MHFNYNVIWAVIFDTARHDAKIIPWRNKLAWLTSQSATQSSLCDLFLRHFCAESNELLWCDKTLISSTVDGDRRKRFRNVLVLVGFFFTKTNLSNQHYTEAKRLWNHLDYISNIYSTDDDECNGKIARHIINIFIIRDENELDSEHETFELAANITVD